LRVGHRVCVGRGEKGSVCGTGRAGGARAARPIQRARGALARGRRSMCR